MRTLTLIAALVATQSAAQNGAPVLVSDPAMCAMIERGEDVQETGMVLNADGMYTIEYHCDFATPLELTWGVDRMQVRAGYCAEPGYVSPTVFAIHTSDYDPNVLTIWQQGTEEPTIFHRCWGL